MLAGFKTYHQVLSEKQMLLCIIQGVLWQFLILESVRFKAKVFFHLYTLQKLGQKLFLAFSEDRVCITMINIDKLLTDFTTSQFVIVNLTE